MKIEKNIPIPQTTKNAGLKPIFSAMEIGDSFLYGEVNDVNKNRASVMICYYNKLLGKRFIQRATTEGIRIWRVEAK